MKRATRLLSTFLAMTIFAMSVAPAADEAPASKDTPQEYGLVFNRPYASGAQARLRARSGEKVFAAENRDYIMEREKSYLLTGDYPSEDAATVGAMVRDRRAALLANGTRVEFVQLFGLPAGEAGFAMGVQVRILGGPAKGQDAFVGRPEAFAVDLFRLKPGEEATLGKGRLMPGEAGIAVVGEVPAYNALLKSWRDGEPRKNNSLARKAESVRFQEPGTRVKVKSVACTDDRVEHYGLAGSAVRVEVLDGRDRGKVGWAFPESIVKAASDAPRGGAAKPARSSRSAPAGWVMYKSDADGFVVELPGPPGRVESQTANGETTNMLRFRARGLEMLVAAVHGPDEIIAAGKGGALDQIRDRIAARFAGGALPVGVSKSNIGSLRGQHFELRMRNAVNDSPHGRGHAYAAGKTAYVVLVAYVREQSVRPEPLRFLNSFSPTGLDPAAEGGGEIKKPK